MPTHSPPCGWTGLHALRRPLHSIFCALVMFAAALPAGADKPENLRYQGYVNDAGDYIDDDSKARMAEFCRDLENKTGNRVVIVTVSNTEGLTPGQFAEKLRTLWINSPNLQERTLVLVLTGQGKIGLGIGSEIERLITHAQVDSILQSAHGKETGGYGQLLVHITVKLVAAIEAESGQPAAPRGGRWTFAVGQTAAPSELPPFPWGFFVKILALLSFLSVYLGRRFVGRGGVWSSRAGWFLVLAVVTYALVEALRHVGSLSESAQKELGIVIIGAVMLTGAVLIVTLVVMFVKEVF